MVSEAWNAHIISVTSGPSLNTTSADFLSPVRTISTLKVLYLAIELSTRNAEAA
jgi:hypothetical protein